MKLKKITILVFTSIAACLAFATKTQAVELTTQVEPTGITYQIRNNWRCYGKKDGSNGTWEITTATNYGECFYWKTNQIPDNYTQIARVYSNNMIDVTEGNYYQVTFIYGGGGKDSPSVQWTLNTREQDWSITEFKELSQGNMGESISLNYNNTGSYGIITGSSQTITNSKVFQITLQAKYTGKTYWFIGWDSNVALLLGYDFQLQMSDIVEFKPATIDSVNQQQQQAGEQAQQDGNEAGNQAQTDANTNTATMFETIGNVLGAITDTPAGDCTLNGNMGNINLGNLNLCQAEIEPIRPIIRAVLYLVMALATYKIMVWIIGAIAGLINWVQTGNEGKETDG